MRQIISLAMALAMSALAAGCKKPAEPATRAAPAHMDYNYSYEKRDVFIEDATADLVEMDQKINDLSGKAAAARVLVEVEAKVKIEDLRTRRVALAKKLDTLKNATPANWNDLKTDYQKSDEAIKSSLRTTSEWLAAKTHG